MKTNSLKELLHSYLYSIYFPLTIALLAYLTWVTPSAYSWPFILLYFAFSFLPLIGDDGRGYLPLIFYCIIIVNKDIHFIGGIPFTLIFSMIVICVSLIIFIIIKKYSMITEVLFFLFLALFMVFLISYFVSIFNDGITNRTGILYLLTFLFMLIIYSLLRSVLGREETMKYLANTIVCFSVAVSCQIFTEMLRTGSYLFASASFTLGWSYTKDTASTFLLLTLPFQCMFIKDKKYLYIIPIIITLLSIIYLSNSSGLTTLLIFAIPLVILTLKNYGKAFPYLTTFVLMVFLSTIGILFGLNQTFSDRVITSLNSFNLLNNDVQSKFIPYWNSFIEKPIIGSSITSFIKDDGTATLASNTILSTLNMGGIIGLVIFLLIEIFQYKIIITKKNEDKWLILVFLLMIELVGIINNTIYNIAILAFYFATLAVFQQTNRPDDVIMHDEFFNNYNSEEASKRATIIPN